MDWAEATGSAAVGPGTLRTALLKVNGNTDVDTQRTYVSLSFCRLA